MSDAKLPTGWSTMKLLSPYQWFVFIVCCLAWDMDCLDQQLFVLARRPAMVDLVPKVTSDDPRIPAFGASLREEAVKTNKPEPSTEQILKARQDGDIATAAGNAAQA